MTRNEKKKNFIKERYTQINIKVPHDIAENFKTACKRNNMSQSLLLQCAMANYIKNEDPEKIFEMVFEQKVKELSKTNNEPYRTLPDRRNAISDIIDQLEQICEAEQNYLNGIPVEFENAEFAQKAERRVTELREVIEKLYDDAFSK